MQEKQYCGIVIKKSDEEIQIKHGTRTELYLIVDFKEIGIKSINVEPNTYFTNNKGDNVCFSLSNHEVNDSEKISFLKQVFELFFMMLIIASGFADIFLIIVFIGMSIEWITKKLDEN